MPRDLEQPRPERAGDGAVPLDELASGDPSDVTGIWFGSRQPGAFQLQIDEVRIQ